MAYVIPWDRKKQFIDPARSLDGFDSELRSFVRFIRPNQTDRLCFDKIRERYVDSLKSYDKELVVGVYGSTAYGLNLPNSDIDFYVWDKSKEEMAAETTTYSLFSLAKHFEKCSFVREVNVIASAKHPILKIVDAVFGTTIDITLGNPAELIRSVELVEQWKSDFPALAPLAWIWKYILQQRNLNETYSGGLGSFSIVVMIKHYLEVTRKEKKRTVGEEEEDKENVKAPPVSGKRERLSEDQSLGKYLLGFCEYFGGFDYINHCITSEGIMLKAETSLGNEDCPWNLVIINPIEKKSLLNMASSSFRIIDLRNFFVSCKIRLNDSINMVFTRSPTVLSSVVFLDDYFSQVRQYRKSQVRGNEQKKRSNKNNSKKRHKHSKKRQMKKAIK